MLVFETISGGLTKIYSNLDKLVKNTKNNEIHSEYVVKKCIPEDYIELEEPIR